MNWLTLNLLLALFTFSVLPAAAQTAVPSPLKSTSNVKVKYDKGKSVTTVSLKPFTLTSLQQEKSAGSNLPLHQMDFEASFSGQGDAAKPLVGDIVLRFHCVAGTYIFLKGQEVIVAVNRDIPGQDRGFTLGNTAYRSNPPKFNSVYEEFLDLKVPADAIKKMAAAETVDIYLGPVPYRFTSKQLAALKEFGTLL